MLFGMHDPSIESYTHKKLYIVDYHPADFCFQTGYSFDVGHPEKVWLIYFEYFRTFAGRSYDSLDCKAATFMFGVVDKSVIENLEKSFIGGFAINGNETFLTMDWSVGDPQRIFATLSKIMKEYCDRNVYLRYGKQQPEIIPNDVQEWLIKNDPLKQYGRLKQKFEILEKENQTLKNALSKRIEKL